MRKVSFHVHDEDYIAGLTIKLVNVPGKGLVPYTWTDSEGHDYRPATYTNREDTDTVNVEVYGGTMEQFLHHREQHARYVEVHGLNQGTFVHFPRAVRPLI